MNEKLWENILDEYATKFEEAAIEGISDSMLKAICRVFSKIRKTKKFSIELPTEALTELLHNSLKESGFSALPDPMLLVLCEQYVELVMKEVISDAGFEELTCSIYKNIKEKYETYQEAEDLTRRQLASKGMLI